MYFYMWGMIRTATNLVRVYYCKIIFNVEKKETHTQKLHKVPPIPKKNYVCTHIWEVAFWNHQMKILYWNHEQKMCLMDFLGVIYYSLQPFGWPLQFTALMNSSASPVGVLTRSLYQNETWVFGVVVETANIEGEIFLENSWALA